MSRQEDRNERRNGRTYPGKGERSSFETREGSSYGSGKKAPTRARRGYEDRREEDEKKERSSYGRRYEEKDRPVNRGVFRYGSTDRREEDGKKKERISYRTNRDESRERTEEEENILFGRNAVREAIKADRGIDRILVAGEQDGSIREILHLAQEKKIIIREVERKKLDEITLPFGYGGKPANHQGIVAYGSSIEYVEIGDILQKAKEKNEDPFLLVMDGIMDPQNLGSILRSADCAGVHGVVIGKRRCASVSAAAVKTAAGAAEHVPVAKVSNITNAIKELKQEGIWVAGADMGGTPMTKAGLKGPVAIVIGSEGEGISSLVKQNCDYLVSIPITGHVGSLNAAVAAAVLLFEKRRQEEL